MSLICKCVFGGGWRSERGVLQDRGTSPFRSTAGWRRAVCVRAGITFGPSGEGKTFHDRFNYTPFIAAPPPPRISNKKHWQQINTLRKYLIGSHLTCRAAAWLIYIYFSRRLLFAGRLPVVLMYVLARKGKHRPLRREPSRKQPNCWDEGSRPGPKVRVEFERNLIQSLAPCVNYLKH